MGQLADAAKKNSNFLKIDKGETVVVVYLGARLVPSTMDPTKESAQYKFSTEHGEKFWTNGNGAIMKFFDTLPLNTKVSITRNPWINKDKSIDSNKSTYEVVNLNTAPGITQASELPADLDKI